MLDIHCHILPALDDGPKTLTEALEVARFCVADGITHIVATPHCHFSIHLLRADILPRVDEFQTELNRAEIPLTIFPGSEIRTSDIGRFREEYDAGILCHLGDDPTYSLLEFSWRNEEYPGDVAAHIGWLLERGTQPIIAHPERHSFFQHDRERLHHLVEAGAWLQITVDSMNGNNGERPQRAAWDYLLFYPNCVLATDAHRLSRCSGLASGYEMVREQLGDGREADLRERSDEMLQHLLSVNMSEWIRGNANPERKWAPDEIRIDG